MPPKMGLRVRSCFHNAFSAVDCQEISGRFWPISALGERQFRVDLHLSGLASGLVTSDASDWSSRMQMGGQLLSLADMAMEVLNVFTQRAIYSHAASIHPILLIIRCRPITCLV